jgi:hypothetical protein
MAAYYNAIAQQDAQLAANAQQQARSNLIQDIGLGQTLGGTALQTQQAADEIARQRMLSNIQTGQGLFGAAAGLTGTGYGLQTQALSPYTAYLGGAQTIEGLGQQALTTGAGLGSSAAQAGAQQGASLLKGGLYAADALQKGATLQGTALEGAIGGLTKSLKDPIAQLIGNLTGNQPVGNTWIPNQY